MSYAHVFIIGVLITAVIIFGFALGTDNEEYLYGSVEYPDQIEPADKVFYPSNAKSTGTSDTITNTQTPEPEDQDEGYSEDNEDLESA